jgi:hypothetical protein
MSGNGRNPSVSAVCKMPPIVSLPLSSQKQFQDVGKAGPWRGRSAAGLQRLQELDNSQAGRAHGWILIQTLSYDVSDLGRQPAKFPERLEQLLGSFLQNSTHINRRASTSRRQLYVRLACADDSATPSQLVQVSNVLSKSHDSGQWASY